MSNSAPTIPAIDILTQHYERQRNQSFTVPGVKGPKGEDFVVYFDPPTPAQAQKIRKRAGGESDDQLTLYTIIYRAKDKSGNLMFEDNAITVQALTENVSGATRTQIARAIMTVTSDDDVGK